MEIDFSQEFETVYGYPLKEPVPHKEGPEHEPTIEIITLEYVALNALQAGEKDANAKEFSKRWALALRIADHGDKGPMELEFDDVALIRRCVEKLYKGARIVGQAREMLDAKRLKAEAEMKAPTPPPPAEKPEPPC